MRQSRVVLKQALRYAIWHESCIRTHPEGIESFGGRGRGRVRDWEIMPDKGEGSMIRGVIVLALAGIPVGGIVGCSTAPETRSERMDLKAEADRAVAQAHRTDPTLRDFMARSAGYAVFPEAGKGGLIVGGGYGKGVLYERGVVTGYCDITQATIGAQAGGQKFTEIVVFETPEAINRFKNNQFTLNAQATAVALASGAAANADYSDNVAVFVTGQEGLMAEASVGGQQFRFTPASTPEVRPAGERLDEGGEAEHEY